MCVYVCVLCACVCMCVLQRLGVNGLCGQVVLVKICIIVPGIVCGPACSGLCGKVVLVHGRNLTQLLSYLFPVEESSS